MLMAIPCTLMRGGTSKGLYFDAKDLPADRETRDRVLLAAMGSPDVRQIDGVGGAHPLTSKIAVISRSQRDDADVDYLFLQVVVDKAEVSDSQNCGNIPPRKSPPATTNSLPIRPNPNEPARIHENTTKNEATDTQMRMNPAIVMLPPDWMSLVSVAWIQPGGSTLITKRARLPTIGTAARRMKGCASTGSR